MRRRTLLGQTIAAAAFAACSSSVPITSLKRLPRLGYATGPIDNEFTAPPVNAFREGLRDHGYIEGENIQIELRYCKCVAHGSQFEFDAFDREFAEMSVDVIIAIDHPVQSAVKATKTIPIVTTFAGADDPVESGLVSSLARPGGNVTGIANVVGNEAGKRLEILKEIAPGIQRVGVIWNGNLFDRAYQKAQEAAPALGIEIVELIMQGEGSTGPTLLVATKHQVDALLVGPGPFTIQEQAETIAAYALERRIPLASTAFGNWVRAGGLVGFGYDVLAIQRRSAYFVDRILKGAKPGDLPIEQPSQFETIINLKTAKALGLTIPPSVLGRATKIVQ